MNDLAAQNLSSVNIRIAGVDDKDLNQCMSGMKMSLDELNFLEKRLDSFSAEEMNLFCCNAQRKCPWGASEISSPRDGFDLINLMYNLCIATLEVPLWYYSLVNSSKDMETMGKELYFPEAISCPTEELRQVNGQKSFLFLPS